MIIITNIKEMQQLAVTLSSEGKTISCVPTMGFLHEGHLSLLDEARKIADITIVTLFVNPTQFAVNEDLAKYPRDINRDIELLESRGCNYLFAPDVKNIYPDGFSTYVNVDGITDKFEGFYRPEHFRGVATIVAKLFNIIKPDFAVFGQKDYQQTLVITRMVEDLNMTVKIIVAQTIREADGLAMSSRNIYLQEGTRAKSQIISKTLFETEKLILSGERDRAKINIHMLELLGTVDELKIDYACSAIADSLHEPDFYVKGDMIVLLIAVRLGSTRLIDNLLIKI